MKREYFSTSSHLSKVTLLAGIFLSQVTPSFASPFIKTYPEPPLVQEGLKFDINQDGQVDFKIDELKHSQPDIQVTSFRMVGLTHIHYRDDPAETPILLHARYQGIFDAPATLPGTEPKHFLFHPNELVFGEFARAESDLIGAKTIRGNFSPSGRTYVGLSVDTLSGGYWGWAEISLIENELRLTATGFESESGSPSLIGRPLPETPPEFNITASQEGMEFSWLWAKSKTYQIEKSSDLENWAAIPLSLDPTPNATTRVTLDKDPNQKVYYYRLVSYQADTSL
ncbi:hypothetical protein N8580_01155 [Akkermansiaceae bacterium]|nr:hypothetical protein [Akkermansiaceae bacterium]MDA9337545.1 hypothetical protein [bacterium]MDB4369323.1 hypothetical protein [Akkermansiaceae bacterium]MDB4377919.1 hypothetical protein [Akkermansiaceae bacterium]MDB4456035.1 hypothetical protein [bacterium]